MARSGVSVFEASAKTGGEVRDAREDNSGGTRR